MLPGIGEILDKTYRGEGIKKGRVTHTKFYSDFANRFVLFKTGLFLTL